MATYSDYCPIADGVEVLGDRWTPLVIRELMVGSTGFNQIHRGLPRMSRSLLAQRLRVLERRGIVVRRETGPGRPVAYHLTPMGEGLVPIVWAIGQWAAEWVFGDPVDEELDGLSLIWRIHQRAVPHRLPRDRVVVHLELTGAGGAEAWLDLAAGQATVCKTDPGLDVDLAVQADSRQMHRWLVGLVPFRDLVQDGDARVLGPGRLARAFPTWFDTSYYAKSLRAAQRRREASGEVAAVAS